MGGLEVISIANIYEILKKLKNLPKKWSINKKNV
jgi:hypothetical protein